ncbi:MAG: ABC-three component system protein [Sporichthyaceae bacterium]
MSGPPVTPQQRIFFYSGDEWEIFIREWATGLAESYEQIKRLGGPNDRGVDVAAFKTLHGFEGPWDCYQGKHYAGAITWSDAFPEMLKVFVAVVGGHYRAPDCYAFLAPRGCGQGLNRLLSKPTELRKKFLEELSGHGAVSAQLDAQVRDGVRVLAETTDFALFQSVELLDALDVHRRTPYYVSRFGGPLPLRPPAEGPPEAIAAHEARYVGQLAEVYSELLPAEVFDGASCSAHAQFGLHFQRQRVAFYSAEALRLHARDSVPAGTFETLQDDVHAGVIEMADTSHPTGMAKLTEVLTASTQLDLTAHALMSVSRMEDRKGICHQLANDDRLTWVQGQP